MNDVIRMIKYGYYQKKSVQNKFFRNDDIWWPVICLTHFMHMYDDAIFSSSFWNSTFLNDCSNEVSLIIVIMIRFVCKKCLFNCVNSFWVHFWNGMFKENYFLDNGIAYLPTYYISEFCLNPAVEWNTFS